MINELKLVPVEPTEEMLEVLHSHVKIQVDTRERTADIINDKEWWAAIVDAAPASPQAAQPVTLPARAESLGTAESDMYDNGWRHGWNAYEHTVRQLGPLYSNADAGEVERWKGIAGRRTAERSEFMNERDDAIAERDTLRAQLAEAVGFLERVSSSSNYPIGYATKDEILAFLSSTAKTEADHE